MFSFRKASIALAFSLLAVSTVAQAASSYPGIGRPATPKEVAAWDIDVRPDFKGLPAGSGSVAQGQDIWEAKCAACHGVFGESNEVFMPLIGGTTAQDVKTGHVASLNDATFPGRTTLMKVATVSTLWDYINRAMPWNAPKSLRADEVYAVLAYLLNLAYVVPDDYTLSDKTMPDVQQRMPNRLGMRTRHALWPGAEFGGDAKPDTANVLCMKNCAVEAGVSSALPDFARNAHGNLRDQNREFGAQRGADTSRAAGQPASPVKALEPSSEAKVVAALLQKNNCTACHAHSSKLVGPPFAEVARKYPGRADYLAGKIRSGGSGIWGAIPMPAQTLSDSDLNKIAQWLATGAGK